jgi:hypothetical protein
MPKRQSYVLALIRETAYELGFLSKTKSYFPAMGDTVKELSAVGDAREGSVLRQYLNTAHLSVQNE